MERRIIHNQHGLGLWRPPKVTKELLDEILKDPAIGRHPKTRVREECHPACTLVGFDIAGLDEIG
jgi:hypothetical protein